MISIIKQEKKKQNRNNADKNKALIEKGISSGEDRKVRIL